MKLKLKTRIIKKLNLTLHPRFESSTDRGFGSSFKKPKSSVSQLLEKQRLRYHHSLTNKQLKRYASNAYQTSGPTGLLLMCDLAMRLDSILFQMGFTDSIRSARQLIRHGHIFVNSYRVSMPAYRCRREDLICVSPKANIRRLVNRYLLQNRRRARLSTALSQDGLSASYATSCVRNQKILIHRDIKPRELTFKIDHLLMIQYFA